MLYGSFRNYRFPVLKRHMNAWYVRLETFRSNSMNKLPQSREQKAAVSENSTTFIHRPIDAG